MSAAKPKATRKPRAKKAGAPVTVEAIKGFNLDLTCRDFKFEIGKEYSVLGEIEPCRNGFHACPVDTVDPLRVFDFYAPGQSRYCLVDQGGEIVPHDNDKASSSVLFVRKEISVHEIIDRAVEYRMKKAKPTGETSNSGTQGVASNSGTQGVASNSGIQGVAMSHACGGKVMCEGEGQALYCSEFNDEGELVSVACGITGRDGIKVGTWYHCRGGKLVAQ